MLRDICRTFKGRRIVVVGDAIADQFLKGSISRVSREAPVFIMQHESTATVPGGAANAAANVSALGGQAILIASVGSDVNGAALLTSMKKAGIDTHAVISADGYTTTTKLRVLAGHRFAVRQQVIRIDYEPGEHMEPDTRLLDNFRAAAADADGVIVSDYGYGTVSTEVFDEAREIASRRGIPLIVDSRHRLVEFQGATSATPNREEVEQILGGECNDEQCSNLREKLGLKALLVTNGSYGMTLFEEASSPVTIPVIGSSDAVDVTGAGDTVIAAYTMALTAGASYLQAAEIANQAGGIVVMKKGTATVTAEELISSLDVTASDSFVQTS